MIVLCTCNYCGNQWRQYREASYVCTNTWCKDTNIREQDPRVIRIDTYAKPKYDFETIDTYEGAPPFPKKRDEETNFNYW